MNNKVKIILAAVIVLGGAYSYVRSNPELLEAVSIEALIDSSELFSAYQSKRSNVQVTGSGVVVKVLPDDLKGSRHQKFILQLPSGISVLVAHNIDLAPRISSLAEGDEVSFSGEYEWNPKGGVVHWTHHDPDGRHLGGWLKHGGKRYE